jgi:hypothetical protein
MKWDLFKDDVPSDYFDINSPEEYEEAFERDITNEYWSNRSHKDDEFYEKHKKDFEKVVDY